MHSQKTILHWSGGKDSSIAFYVLLKQRKYQVGKLLTSINAEHERVTMHGVRRELIESQSESIGLPLSILELPNEPDMQEYDRLMMEKMQQLQQEGFTQAAFGDIYLEDLKTYRQQQMEKVGFKPLFPIWKQDTKALIRQFIEDGFKAIIVCSKSEKLDKRFVGREINENFLSDLPADVDPCGENGEFHTFVYDGPFFSKPISFRKGEITYREYDAPSESEKDNDPKKMGFWFCDLIPEK